MLFITEPFVNKGGYCNRVVRIFGPNITNHAFRGEKMQPLQKKYLENYIYPFNYSIIKRKPNTRRGQKRFIIFSLIIELVKTTAMLYWNILHKLVNVPQKIKKKNT